MAVALKLGGDLEIAGVVFGGGPQYQPASEGQGLRGGTGPDQGLQLDTLWISQANHLRVRHRHGEHPCSWDRGVITTTGFPISHKIPEQSRLTITEGRITKRTSSSWLRSEGWGQLSRVNPAIVSRQAQRAFIPIDRAAELWGVKSVAWLGDIVFRGPN